MVAASPQSFLALRHLLRYTNEMDFMPSESYFFYWPNIAVDIPSNDSMNAKEFCLLRNYFTCLFAQPMKTVMEFLNFSPPDSVPVRQTIYSRYRRSARHKPLPVATSSPPVPAVPAPQVVSSVLSPSDEQTEVEEDTGNYCKRTPLTRRRHKPVSRQ